MDPTGDGSVDDAEPLMMVPVAVRSEETDAEVETYIDRETIRRDRLTVVEYVSHQGVDEQPTSVENKFSRWLDSSEQVYSRRMRVGEEWTPLDYGWLTDKPIALVTIRNLEGDRLQVNPTDDERREIAERIIQVAVVEDRAERIQPIAVVRPGEGSFRLEPAEGLPEFQVRCLRGVAKFVVTVYPG